MKPKASARRGGILKALLILCVLAVVAVAIIVIIAKYGGQMQQGINKTGDKLKEKVSNKPDDNSGKPPAVEQPVQPPAQTPNNPKPPVVRETPKPPPVVRDTPKPVYTAKNPPPVQKNYYTIAPGDTPYSIAETFYEDGALWTLIAKANGFKDEKDFKAGTMIVIPGR